jgi:hypothetical protein
MGTRLYEPTTKRRTMSEELQERTEALRRMVETRDLIIADLEREIKEVKTDREFIRGWAVRCQNEMDHQASLAEIARMEVRELKAMLHGHLITTL